MSVLKNSLIHAANMLQKYLSKPRDVASFFCVEEGVSPPPILPTALWQTLRPPTHGHTSSDFCSASSNRWSAAWRTAAKAGSTFRKKDPLYHLATSHFIMLSVCHNAAQQMMEQLIIHQLVLGLWLTSRAFSGYMRVRDTEGEKEKRTIMFQAMVGFWKGNVQIWWR